LDEDPAAVVSALESAKAEVEAYHRGHPAKLYGMAPTGAGLATTAGIVLTAATLTVRLIALTAANGAGSSAGV
jgi:hypothetical protein